MDLISLIIIFALSLFIGYEVITRVPPTLHTPLMSGSNAISGIVIVGAIIIASNANGLLSTILSVFAVILATINGYVHDAMVLGIASGGGKNTAIGIGMWLGLYMAFNVWFIIWPNQKRALGIVECDPEAKAKSARTAMLFSRTNTLLSLPMLLSMVAAQNLY